MFLSLKRHADMPTPPAGDEGSLDCSNLWHVCWVAAVGRDFFPHPLLYAKARDRLLQAHSSPGRALISYLLMPTEIHVVSRLAAGESSARLAREFGNVLSRWVSQADPVRSPVLAGPHLAHRLASEADVKSDVAMLGWRPVRKGLCTSPLYYSHGALRPALGRTHLPGFDARALLDLFGTSVGIARSALRDFLKREAPDERATREWELIRGLRVVQASLNNDERLGRSVRQMRRPEGAALVVAAGDGLEGAICLLELWVASRLGLAHPGELRLGRSIESARARALVAVLAVRFGLCSAAEIARRFGKAKATLCEQMAACRNRRQDRVLSATSVRRIIEEGLAILHLQGSNPSTRPSR